MKVEARSLYFWTVEEHFFALLESKSAIKESCHQYQLTGGSQSFADKCAYSSSIVRARFNYKGTVNFSLKTLFFKCQTVLTQTNFKIRTRRFLVAISTISLSASLQFGFRTSAAPFSSISVLLFAFRLFSKSPMRLLQYVKYLQDPRSAIKTRIYLHSFRTGTST